MKISYHASERFLQRVLELKDYTKEHIKNANKLLQKELQNMVSHRQKFILPSFPNFLGVVKSNILVTIIPK